MLTFVDNESRNFGSISRRRFVGSVGLAFGGTWLANLLRAESAAGIGLSHKAVINVHLDGGPPHMDMIDLKPDAPAEIRGEFRPIQTRIEGVSISEMLPRLAMIADRIAFVRSLVGSADAHDAFQCQSGFKEIDLKPIGGRPAMGAVVSHLKGPTSGEMPAFVDLMQGRPMVRNSARPGFLGRAYQPFRPDLSKTFRRELEPGMVKELERLGPEHATQLTLPPELSKRRVIERVSLRQRMAQFQRELDESAETASLNAFERQAVQILTSGRFAQAMDLTSEDAKTRARYALPGSRTFPPSATSDGPDGVLKFLLARRLVEAGVRCVSLSISDFDTHSKNFPRMRQVLPILDHGLATLIEDLDERGMLDDVSIVVWGEFGRTPKIDASNGGRHHWPKVGMAMLAGGGIRAGQVIGSTDKDAGAANTRPVHVQEVFATLYRNLGIDPRTTILEDPTGRPQNLLQHAEPIAELVG
jgi:hypothetical protein